MKKRPSPIRDAREAAHTAAETACCPECSAKLFIIGDGVVLGGNRFAAEEWFYKAARALARASGARGRLPRWVAPASLAKIDADIAYAVEVVAAHLDRLDQLRELEADRPATRH